MRRTGIQHLDGPGSSSIQWGAACQTSDALLRQGKGTGDAADHSADLSHQNSLRSSCSVTDSENSGAVKPRSHFIQARDTESGDRSWRLSSLSAIVICTLQCRQHPSLCTLRELRLAGPKFIISGVYCIQLLKMDPVDGGQLFVLSG